MRLLCKFHIMNKKILRPSNTISHKKCIIKKGANFCLLSVYISGNKNLPKCNKAFIYRFKRFIKLKFHPYSSLSIITRLTSISSFGCSFSSDIWTVISASVSSSGLITNEVTSSLSSSSSGCGDSASISSKTKSLNSVYFSLTEL